MDSIWWKQVDLPTFPTLKSDLQTEIAVIGGGLAGILTAYYLHQAGADVVVLEANRIGSGQTSGTTAKLTAQHGLRYSRLSETVSPRVAGDYARTQMAAVMQLRRLVQEQNISCDWEDCTTFLYTCGVPKPLQEEYEACSALGLDVFLTRDTELPFAVEALGLRNQARFHPLKLLLALAADLPIYEQTRVLEVHDHKIRTANGSTVTAKKIIFTCHFPFVNFPGLFFARQHQERSYVLALENVPHFNHCYLGIDDTGLSLRSCGQYLLLGGNGHRTGENQTGNAYRHLEQAAKRFWPQCRIASRWSAQDCIPMDGIPYIGSYSKGKSDWLVATGFQKWGMSNSVVAAEILSKLALGQPLPQEYALYSPHRFHPAASAQQLVADSAHSVLGLGKRFLAPGRISIETLPAGHGGIVELDGKKVGAYRDTDGSLYAVSIKCPHLGCQLEWNPDEKSWDCPCHGSRFDFRGNLLNGPAQKSNPHAVVPHEDP